jgi:hypothetical protein
LPIADWRLASGLLLRKRAGGFDNQIGNRKSTIGNAVAREVLKEEPARHGIHEVDDRAPAANIP